LIVYFSSVSENTKRFVEKLGIPAERIPLRWDSSSPLKIDEDYVLILPTYGAGNDSSTVPKQVVKFLNIESNRLHLRGVVGMGNTNFGEHYCKAAEIVSSKVGVPLLHRVEIFGTKEDVETVREKIDNNLSGPKRTA
jgi:protein involved in ribonucleotide reduction